MWQFYHQRISIPNQTYALLVDKDIIGALDGKYVVMEMGISFCHPQDNYDKKVGRDLAISRAEPHLFRVYLKEEDTTHLICQTTDTTLKFKGSHLIGVAPANYFV
jgi:hypothetical protein